MKKKYPILKYTNNKSNTIYKIYRYNNKYPIIFYLSKNLKKKLINKCWICQSNLDNEDICPKCGYY